MSQTFQPCCERVLLIVADAPRTEGANPSPEILRCASCGSSVSIEEMTEEKSDAVSNAAGALAEKLGLRRKQSQRKIETKIKHWL